MIWVLAIGLAAVAFSLLILGTGAPAWVSTLILAAGTGAMIAALLITMLAATREHTWMTRQARGSGRRGCGRHE